MVNGPRYLAIVSAASNLNKAHKLVCRKPVSIRPV